jgi:glycosyltransferase involved in cell wall biosynthesis
MTEQKGFDVLLRALPAVLRVEPSAELMLVGDGPLRAELEALVDELGLRSAVTMPGALRHEDMAELLASASLVAIPSRWEGMPLIALEAAAAGRAVVATPVQGLADVVVDGETGVLVPPERTEPLAAALSGLLTDPSRAAALGAAARRRVVERFSLEQAVDAYDDLFSDLLGSRAER